MLLQKVLFCFSFFYNSAPLNKKEIKKSLFRFKMNT
jgi:hypothetical protein